MRRPQIVIAIIKLNFMVFLLWIYSFTTDSKFMVNNFLVSWSGLSHGRWWTLFSSVFSHNMLFHILINMYVLFGFGSVIEDVLGQRRFLLFYLFAGAFGSLSHSVVSAVLLQEPWLPALGASGAIAGVIMFFSILFPKEKLLLMGIIPMPAYVAAILFVGVDLMGLISQTRGDQSPIGHGAHLGGALFGVVYYFIFSSKRIHRCS